MGHSILGWQRLQGHRAIEDLIAREVNHAHPASRDLTHDSVLANRLSGKRRVVVENQIRADGPSRHVEVAIRSPMAVEQALHLAQKLRVGTSLGSGEGVALGRVDVERGVEDFVDALPAFAGHGSGLRSSSRASQARAIVQCRFTVAGEVSIASAVSSTVRPPKNRNSTMRA